MDGNAQPEAQYSSHSFDNPSFSATTAANKQSQQQVWKELQLTSFGILPLLPFLGWANYFSKTCLASMVVAGEASLFLSSHWLSKKGGSNSRAGPHTKIFFKERIGNMEATSAWSREKRVALPDLQSPLP